MSRARDLSASLVRGVKRLGKLPCLIAALWIFALGAHAVLIHLLTNQSHAAAMLTGPTSSILLLGALLVGTRLVVYLALPSALAWIGAWRLGSWLAGWLLKSSRSEKPAHPDRALQRSSQYE